LREHTTADIEFYLYDNFYPAGDEFIIVYDVAGRLIPPGGIPLQVGCAVNNVETLINISRAMEEIPVTHTALTVAGAVKKPVSAIVPIGVSAREVLQLAGGSVVEQPALLDGGAMMGKPLLDLDTPVTKTSGGYIVLSPEHRLIRRKTQTEQVNTRIARSACDQCRFCTELCPRYLLGYAIEPHAVMRSVGFAGDKEAYWARLGLLCCECGVCDLFACPEDLPPKDMCIRSKKLWRARSDKAPEPLQGTGKVHPLRDSRRIPIPRLIQRLGLTQWDLPAPLTTQIIQPKRVQLRLQQHIGAPARPIVREGDIVAVGQLIATIPPDKLGANLHASIDGRISRIDEHSIWIAR
jgi:Na+-translocating ferredoxin:NAD+ oxidoreductase RnfC subunit